MSVPPGGHPPPGGYPPGGYPPGGYPPSGYPPYGFAPPDHPKATTALILGILGVVFCQLAAPFAWATGRQTVREIDASGGRIGGRGQAQAGYVLGIVGSVILALSVAFFVLWLAFGLALIGGGLAGSTG